MKVNFIRFSRSTQNRLAYQCNELTGIENVVSMQFDYYQVLTSGWKSGAKNRMRNFSTIAQVQAYFRKLNDGGWLSNDEYRKAEFLASLFEAGITPPARNVADSAPHAWQVRMRCDADGQMTLDEFDDYGFVNAEDSSIR